MKRALSVLLVITSAVFSFGHAQADELLDFVHRFMRIEMDYTRQFQKPESYSPSRDTRQDRWPNRAAAHAERIGYISREYLLDQNIEPDSQVDAYRFDDYKILGRSGSFVFIRQLYDDCKKDGCSKCTDCVSITLNVISENGRYLLRPGGRGQSMIRYWWSAHTGHFENPDTFSCPMERLPPQSLMLTAVDGFMRMMQTENEGKFTRRQRLERFSEAHLSRNSTEPALMKIDNFSFDSHAVVGIGGPFVDVELIGGCTSCGKRFLRIRTVSEDGKVRIVPGRVGKKWITYWWTYSTDRNPPPCAVRQSIDIEKR